MSKPAKLGALLGKRRCWISRATRNCSSFSRNSCSARLRWITPPSCAAKAEMSFLWRSSSSQVANPGVLLGKPHTAGETLARLEAGLLAGRAERFRAAQGGVPGPAALQLGRVTIGQPGLADR